MPTFEFGTFVNVALAVMLWLYLMVQSLRHPNPYGGTREDMLHYMVVSMPAVLAAALLRAFMVQEWPQAPGIEILAGVTEIAACIFLLTVLTARLRDQLRFNRVAQAMMARDQKKEQTGETGA